MKSFKDREDLVRARLAEINGHEILPENDPDNPACYAQSGWEFDEKEIQQLIKDELIKDEKELEKMYLDEIPTIDHDEMIAEFREGTHRSLDRID